MDLARGRGSWLLVLGRVPTLKDVTCRIAQLALALTGLGWSPFFDRMLSFLTGDDA